MFVHLHGIVCGSLGRSILSFVSGANTTDDRLDILNLSNTVMRSMSRSLWIKNLINLLPQTSYIGRYLISQ